MGMSISILSILGKEALIFPVARGGGRGELAQVHESCLRAREVNKSITLKAIAMPNSATIDWSQYVETIVPLPPLPSPLPFQRVRPANYTQTLFPIPPGRVKLRLVGVRRGEGGMTFFPPQAASAEACRWDRRKGRRRLTTTQHGCPGLRSGGWAGRAAPSHVRIGKENVAVLIWREGGVEAGEGRKG